ncbi:hypothetical protein MRB53_038799 [Persea americana]|nr:hypothetical protein MRB53_038799 [Persea americana]
MLSTASTHMMCLTRTTATRVMATRKMITTKLQIEPNDSTPKRPRTLQNTESTLLLKHSARHYDGSGEPEMIEVAQLDASAETAIDASACITAHGWAQIPHVTAMVLVMDTRTLADKLASRQRAARRDGL